MTTLGPTPGVADSGRSIEWVVSTRNGPQKLPIAAAQDRSSGHSGCEPDSGGPAAAPRFCFSVGLLQPFVREKADQGNRYKPYGSTVFPLLSLY